VHEMKKENVQHTYETDTIAKGIQRR
jgi:hypothetical protein